MDSATQFLLGASLAGATLAPVVGRKALLIGGLVATLPDLDVLLPLANPIDAMTYHRGASHSVIVLTAAAPIIAWAASKLARIPEAHWRRHLLTIWLCLITHPILDALTTYGTQILWPLNIGPPVALPSVFIIDPIYTAMLLAGVLIIAFVRNQPEKALRTNRTLLTLACVYLGIGISAHFIVKAKAAATPELKGANILVQPTPFNILFWQVLAVNRDHFYVGFTSPLSTCTSFPLSKQPRVATWPGTKSADPSIQRLKWFTNGFYTYQKSGKTWAIANLRIGFHPNLVFRFAVAERSEGKTVAVEPKRLRIDRVNRQLFGDLIGRIRKGVTACT